MTAAALSCLPFQQQPTSTQGVMMRDDMGLDLLAGLVFLLEEWADWQRKDKGIIGYPAKSCGISSDPDRYSKTVDEMYEEMDEARSRIVDSCIDDLLPAQRAAIMRRYEIAAVFRFPRMNYAECLEQAHERLLCVLPRKGVDIPARRSGG